MTGSTTSFSRPRAAITAATSSMMARFASMPVLRARIFMSSATASIWARTIEGSSACQAVTDTVFWAVMAVIAVVPWMPWAAKVRRSAWIPAPPPESEPAIERATFMVFS
jgi:hypothetical protein